MNNKLERSTEVRYYEQDFDIGLEFSHSKLYVLYKDDDTSFILGERPNVIHLRDFLTRVIDGDEEQAEDA